jgi:spore photoproduct lyase
MNNTILTHQEQQFIEQTAMRLHLSDQNRRKVREAAIDLRLWQEGSIIDLWDERGSENLTGKTRTQFILGTFFSRVDKLRESAADYSRFTPPRITDNRKVSIEPQHPHEAILGSCPVASEKTRCCNLQTLDAVKQCGFACSYCSIQSFYDEGRVYFHEHLREKLSCLTFDEDKIYHIGTGQSSDSLMWGDEHGLLTDLFDFARQHKNIILELKTKSSRTGWMESFDVPPNVVATWSLNPQNIIDNEELLTASLEQRLSAARKAADRKIPVGFHLHPIIHHTGWHHAYDRMVERIVQLFSPEEVVMVSMGTLTFIRPVIKKIRSQGRSTKTTQIPFSDAAGKLSYPFETKLELFTHLYSCFPQQWKQEVFFYLCMEDPALWKPVFGYEYESNEQFEEAMKSSYMDKIMKILA